MLQPAPVTRMAQLPEGLAFDLSDALPGQAEFIPYLFQRVFTVTSQAEAQAQDTGLARCEACLLYTSPSPRD